MTEIFSAATLEEAKQLAARSFGAELSDISFEILEEPKKSLLGGIFGKKEEFRVKATFEPKTSEVSVEEPAAGAIPQETVEPAEQPAPESSEEATVEPDETEATGKEVSPEIQLEKMQIGASYLQSILDQFAPEVHCIGKLENGISYLLEGNGAGSLIGKRGETLDALQYLTSMVANRGDKEYVRVTLDTCNYRDKRRKALQELAQRISKTVLRTGKSVSLEPMNPYERRIIHSAVTGIDGVSSHSIGEEPNRRVIITNDSVPASKQNDKFARSYRGGSGKFERSGGKFERNGERRRDDRRRDDHRRDRRPSGEGPKKLDLSTSFEKDYKRPKPEDALNAGVYGKIDI